MPCAALTLLRFLALTRTRRSECTPSLMICLTLTFLPRFRQIFDAVSYSKGASVLKMLSNLVGEETFLKGV